MIVSLVEKHIGLRDNSDCEIGEDYIKVVIDRLDITSLPSPLSKQQQLDSIDARQRVLVSMSYDSVYDEKTRAKIAERSKIPIRNDYIPPLNRFLQEKGIDPTKPYRVFYSERTFEYIFLQNKVEK